MNWKIRGTRVACLSLGLTLADFALCQETADGFSLNRFSPSERGSDWFVADSLDFRGDRRLALGVVIDYAHKPLVVYDATSGEEIDALVQNQLFAHLGGALVLWDRVRFGVNLPVAVYQNGSDQNIGGDQVGIASATTLGDMRVSGDVRLLGEYHAPLTLAAGLEVFAPTGDSASFTSDGTMRFMPRLLAAGRVEKIVYAARVGFHVRPKGADFAGSPVGHEVFAAAAVGAELSKGWILGPEIFGSTVVSEGGAFFDRTTTPFELIFSTRYQVSNSVRLGAGIGPGLTRGLGAPALRGLASLEWVPFPEPAAPPRPDSDGDGIFDHEDACPNQPGVATGDPATHGCPPLADRDRDGIFDDEDACPDEPGVKTDDPKTNGCPPLADRDRDGIFDDEDACPDQAGPPSEDPKKHGCPLAHVEKDQIKIVEQVKFAYNSDRIVPESEPILNAVLRILEEYPDIVRVSIHGHTDSQGNDDYNLKLSERRAASVVRWLATHGIDSSRLESKGFGETKPIDSNDTEEGQRNNRRVEFHILERKAKNL